MKPSGWRRTAQPYPPASTAQSGLGLALRHLRFIGASGERYPCHDITGAYELDGTERFEAIKPEGMEEPVDAVCIGGVAVERIQDAGGRADHLYESLDWVIELP
ncbi:MAG: hypothetical protein ACLRWQ_14765 [Flavonifractor plautii]